MAGAARFGGTRIPVAALPAVPLQLQHPEVAVALLSGTMGPAAVADPWKNCAFNDQPIRCRDSHSPDGTVRIVWEDGKAMTYRLVEEGFPVSTRRDSLGGMRTQRMPATTNNAGMSPSRLSRSPTSTMD